MKLIDRLNDSANQKFTLNAIDSGDQITCVMQYLPTQRGWVLNVSYNGFELNGIAVVNSFNILRNYRNIIPFGLTVTTIDGFDPYYVQDFSSQRAQMYLLSTSEVEELETALDS